MTTAIPMTEAPAETTSSGKGDALLGSSRIVRELPQRLIANCKAYASIVELLRSLDGEGDVACIFASDRAMVADVRIALGSRKILLSGRVLRDTTLKAQIGDSHGQIVASGESFAAFSEAHKTAGVGIVIIDRAPTSKNYCAKVLGWARASLHDGGYIIVRNYAFWRKAKEENQMVVALNQFAIAAQASVVGLAFNGNGFPDLCLRFEAIEGDR